MSNRALWDHSRHWLNLRPVYAAGQWILENLPLFVGYGITRTATELVCRLSPSQRAGIESNVRQALSHLQKEVPADERERRVGDIVHRIFTNRGVWFADLSVMAGNRQLDGIFQFQREGCWEALHKAQASGRGAILASAHLGNWFGGGVIVSRSGVPLRSVMYRNHAGDEMDRKVARRANVRQIYIDGDPLSMMELIRALRRGEVIAVLADKPWDSRSLEVDFFGKPCRFPVGPVRLARLAGVPIFPAFCTWREPRQYEAVLCDPIEVGSGDPEAAEHDALSRLAAVIQKYVASNLPVWFNFTPAWSPT